MERAKQLKVKAGIEPGADLGLVISKQSMNCICNWIGSDVKSGARLVHDGQGIKVPNYKEGNLSVLLFYMM